MCIVYDSQTFFFIHLFNYGCHLPDHRNKCKIIYLSSGFQLLSRVGDNVFPYVFIGDEAFPLMENLMNPYRQKQLNHGEKIFNCRMCRARRIFVNVFGILAARSRLFLLNIDVILKR